MAFLLLEFLLTGAFQRFKKLGCSPLSSAYQRVCILSILFAASKLRNCRRNKRIWMPIVKGGVIFVKPIEITSVLYLGPVLIVYVYTHSTVYNFF